MPLVRKPPSYRSEKLHNDQVKLCCGDALAIMKHFPTDGFDFVVTDPPYGLEFMGKGWDHGVPGIPYWAEVIRVLKPGGHLLAFGGSRTYHRLACAVEDAGFEIRDQIMWLYGSGFPKSHDVSKAIDKAAGAEREGKPRLRVDGKPTGHDGGWKNSGCDVSIDFPDAITPAAKQWEGWGTALKPAHEPIVMARKPLIGTVAANVLAHGTGAINVDGCRVSAPDGVPQFNKRNERADHCFGDGLNGSNRTGEMDTATGRWPANVIHDGSDEVMEGFPDLHGHGSTVHSTGAIKGIFKQGDNAKQLEQIGGEGGSVARFFYTAKADADDRIGSKHPTVKPIDLMQWLVRLITPRGGIVLDPFAGTGTTAEAALREGCLCILIEKEEEYQDDCRRRMNGRLRGLTR